MSNRSSFLVALCLLGCSSPGSTAEVDATFVAGTEFGSGGGGGSAPEGGDEGTEGSKTVAVCGNGVIEPGEACDDGKTGLCPADCRCSFEYGEHCYIVERTPSNWETSLASCQYLGMHLASLTTLDELKYVVGATFALSPDQGDGLWIGANDNMAQGKFVWDDDEPLGAEAASMWAPGEPKNYGPPISCVSVNPTAQLFSVLCCHYQQSFLCESL